jgi:hypothetical protein
MPTAPVLKNERRQELLCLNLCSASPKALPPELPEGSASCVFAMDQRAVTGISLAVDWLN